MNLSSVWQKWTKARHDLYAESKEEAIRLHGRDIFESRVKFYGVIDQLFAGHLGGVRITGRRPSQLEAKLLAGRAKNLSSEGMVHVVEGKTRKRNGAVTFQ